MDNITKLLALEEIRHLKALYTHYTDQKNSKDWAELFTEDCVVEMRDCLTPKHPITGKVLPVRGFDSEWLTKQLSSIAWPLRGKAQVGKFHRDALGNSGLQAGQAGVDQGEEVCISTQHGCFNSVLEITSDSTATGIWPTRVFAQYADASPLNRVWFTCNYHETYEKVKERWLIKSLRLEVLWIDAWGPGDLDRGSNLRS